MVGLLDENDCEKHFVYSKPHQGFVVPRLKLVGYEEGIFGEPEEVFRCVISKRGKRPEDKAKFCEWDNLQPGSQAWSSSNGGSHKIGRRHQEKIMGIKKKYLGINRKIKRDQKASHKKQKE